MNEKKHFRLQTLHWSRNFFSDAPLCSDCLHSIALFRLSFFSKLRGVVGNIVGCMSARNKAFIIFTLWKARPSNLLRGKPSISTTWVISCSQYRVVLRFFVSTHRKINSNELILIYCLRSLILEHSLYLWWPSFKPPTIWCSDHDIWRLLENLLGCILSIAALCLRVNLIY